MSEASSQKYHVQSYSIKLERVVKSVSERTEEMLLEYSVNTPKFEKSE